MIFKHCFFKYIAIGTVSLLISGCDQFVSADQCKGEILLGEGEDVFLSDNVEDYFDADCDGIPRLYDCSDDNPKLLSKIYDVDCDGNVDRKIVAAGGAHTCIIQPNNFGKIACWGEGDAAEAPESILYLEIAAGAKHTCAISNQGTLECWGNNNFGQTNSPAGSFKRIYAGDYHSCAIKTDDTVQCWGAGKTFGECDLQQLKLECGQSTYPQEKFQELSLDLGYSCGITTLSELKCWGDAPAELFPSIDIKQIDIHHTLSCGLDAENQIHCNTSEQHALEVCSDSCETSSDGECDDGAPDAQFAICEWGTDCMDCGTRSFEDFRGDRSFIQVQTGYHTLCYIDEGGLVSCISKNQSNIHTENSYFSQINISPYHNRCGIQTNGKLRCWGDICKVTIDPQNPECSSGVSVEIPESVRLWNQPN